MVKIVLLKVWRMLPMWGQAVLSRIVRPLFQVFAVAVVFDDKDRILLVKTTYNSVHPWGMPGGSLEYGETLEDAVVREVWEETSLKVEIERFLFVKTWTPDRVGMYYICHIEEGEFTPSDEVSEIGYFPMANLPDVRPLDVALIEQIYAER